jgi:hypothetical protein
MDGLQFELELKKAGADGHVIFIPGQTPAFQNISN